MRYLAVLLLLAGCATTVSPVVPHVDGYMLTAENQSGATHGQLQERAIQEATAYCAKQGKKMQVRDVRGHGSPGYTATTTNLTFACTDK